MRKKGMLFLGAAILMLASFNLSWGQCPEDPNDRGECDTLNVVCLDSDQTPGTGPWFVRFPYLVTHDQTEISDSVAGFVIPIGWTRTNPSAFCSASTYWNTTSALYIFPDFNRSIFRHIVEGTDTLLHNRMGHLGDDFMGGEWDTRILELDSDQAYARMSAVASQVKTGSLSLVKNSSVGSDRAGIGGGSVSIVNENGVVLYPLGFEASSTP